MSILVIGVASSIAWFLSMLAGGGSPFVLMPIITIFLGAQAIAPVLTVGLLVGNGQRTLFFWDQIDWRVNWYYFPGAIAGAALGAYAFTRIQADWLHLIVAIALIWMVVDAWLSRKVPNTSSSVQPWHFSVYGFFYAAGSGLIGSMGPVMNPLYLNYGLEKEAMIATKSINVLVVHIAKIIVYASLGAFTPTYLAYGLLIGLASIPANFLGKHVLERISSEQFRQAVLAFVAMSGAFLLWEQRGILMMIW
jgi:uncharacterized membrane protein YfcA